MADTKTFKKLSVTKLSTNFSEAIKLVEVPLISPNDNQVLIKVLYVGVSASDINASSGRLWTDGNVPFDIGTEAIGLVESVGINVTTIKRNDYALFYCTLEIKPRAYAQYIYVKPDEIITISDPNPQYLGLAIGGLTASIGLDLVGQIKESDKVLITAASGGTGHIAVQWAKLKGCHVIGLTSSKQKSEMLFGLGVDRVINYKEESIDEVLKNEYPDGIDVIWETIGGKVLENLFTHLSLKGRLLIVGGIDGYKTVGFPDISIPNLPAQLLTKSRSLRGFAYFNYNEYHCEYFAKLLNRFHKNEMNVILEPFYGLNEVIKAVDRVNSGLNIGKVVVKIAESINPYIDPYMEYDY